MNPSNSENRLFDKNSKFVKSHVNNAMLTLKLVILMDTRTSVHAIIRSFIAMYENIVLKDNIDALSKNLLLGSDPTIIGSLNRWNKSLYYHCRAKVFISVI